MSIFDKYEKKGAYHWKEMNRFNIRLYNPVLAARYHKVNQLVLNLKGCFSLEKIHYTQIRDSPKILDLGCGDCYLSHLLALSGFKVYSIDYSFSGLRYGKEKLENYKYRYKPILINASIYNLPFKNNVIDLAIMSDVIEHLNFPEQALKEISRILSNSGILIITTPIEQSNFKWDVLHVNEFTPNSLRILLKSFFNHVTINEFMPIRFYNLYQRKIFHKLPLLRYLINIFCALGINLFSIDSGSFSPFGQQIAFCKKRE